MLIFPYIEAFSISVYINTYTPSLEGISILFTAYIFPLIVPHWFAETYMKEFATREYHLLLEVITLMVRNTVEGVRFTCIIMDCFVHAVECS
jgi:hypothetical protein